MALEITITLSPWIGGNWVQEKISDPKLVSGTPGKCWYMFNKMPGLKKMVTFP